MKPAKARTRKKGRSRVIATFLIIGYIYNNIPANINKGWVLINFYPDSPGL
jgi:hypothetical protein